LRVNKRDDINMKNFEISYILSDIADMLEISGENYFKVQAYRKAARAVKKLNVEMQDFIVKSSPKEIDGIGEVISEKILDILSTGTCRCYEDFKERFPRVLLDMLKISGLGAKRIKVIYDALKISSIDELEKAAKNNLIRILPGMGAKTELSILKGIKMIKNSAGKLTLAQALIIADDTISFLESMPEVEKADYTGVLRRRVEMSDSIDLLVSSYLPNNVIVSFIQFPKISEVIDKNPKRLIAIHDLGIRIDLRVVKPTHYISSMQKFTGCQAHYDIMCSLAEKKGYFINEYGIDTIGKLKPVQKSEVELYNRIGIPYIIPELRENRGEIQAAIDGNLPKVVEIGDIRGDIHVHTDWSDGTDSIESMVEYAISLGYDYIAITDHSKSLKIAGGLEEERLFEQRKLINKLNKSLNGFRILSGIEVDILSDDILDFDDTILGGLDLVIASIHTGFRQDKRKITNRILSACENPHVHIIAHPTGRILGRREPYDVDIDAIISKAAETGTILEINSSPDRLDLNDKMAKKAKDMGVKISVATDAHGTEELKDIKYGVWVARRGWLEKNDIVNTMPLNDLLKELKKN
jgi:DNA polymerase (family 10)